MRGTLSDENLKATAAEPASNVPSLTTSNLDENSSPPKKRASSKVLSATSTPTSSRVKKSDEPQSPSGNIELKKVDPELFDAKGVPQGDAIVTYEEEKIVMVSRLVDGRPRIEAATIKLLVEKLANQEAQDHDYLRTFLLTFRHVLKPIELMEILFQR